MYISFKQKFTVLETEKQHPSTHQTACPPYDCRAGAMSSLVSLVQLCMYVMRIVG